ncbi:MAG: hypothetical protein E1N59_2615 [Puniceicoccaceae bacterium 5H]|nr:MAG: hypothetical protein E1N59_2615 [Puniceicoccaceae bacterium 5H]
MDARFANGGIAEVDGILRLHVTVFRRKSRDQKRLLEIYENAWRPCVTLAIRRRKGEVAVLYLEARAELRSSYWRLRDGAGCIFPVAAGVLPRRVELRQLRYLIDFTQHPWYARRGLVVASWRSVPAEHNPVALSCPVLPELEREYRERWVEWDATERGEGELDPHPQTS